MAGNLITNPGFENGATGWTFGPSVPEWEPPLTELVAAPVYAGVFALSLHRSRISLDPGGAGPFVFVSGFAEQTFPTVAGRIYPVALWIYGTLANAIPLGLWIDTGGGLVELARSGPSAGWYLWTLPGFVATGSAARLRIQPLAPPRVGAWIVDDILVGPEAAMQRHRHAIVSEMVLVLKGISGTSYWTSLGSRVYTRFRAPSELGESEFPVLFVIETPVKSEFRNDDHVIKSSVTLRIVGYTRELSTDPLVSTSTSSINKLRDDVMRVLLGNLKLNGKLGGPMLFVDEQFDYGVDPTYAGFALDVRCPYYFTANELGPLAT